MFFPTLLIPTSSPVAWPSDCSDTPTTTYSHILFHTQVPLNAPGFFLYTITSTHTTNWNPRRTNAPRHSIPRSLDVKISNIKGNLYTAAFINAPDCTEYTVQPFPTNGDRFAATEVSKRTNPVYY